MAEWTIRMEGDTCFVRIAGDAGEEDAVEAAHRFRAAIARARLRQIHLVIDMLDVSSYVTGARVEWQELLQEHKHRFREVTFLLENPVFRMAGSAVALVTGIPIRMLGAKDRARVWQNAPDRSAPGSPML